MRTLLFALATVLITALSLPPPTLAVSSVEFGQEFTVDVTTGHNAVHTVATAPATSTTFSNTVPIEEVSYINSPVMLTSASSEVGARTLSGHASPEATGSRDRDAFSFNPLPRKDDLRDKPMPTA